jgi:hypothetical protein
MSSGKRPPGRKRPPHTIDLDATEVSRGPVDPDLQGAPVTEPSPAPSPEAAFQTPPPEPPNEPPHVEPEPAPANRPGMTWLPPNFAARVPWPLIGAAAAGAGGVVLLLLLFWGLGVGSSGHDEASTLTPRLASIETQLRELAARPAPQGIDPKAIDTLSTRLAKVESAVTAPRPAASPSADPAIASRLAGTEAIVKSLNDNVAALSKRSEDFVNRADDLIKRSDQSAKRADELTAALRASSGRMDALAASMTELQSSTRAATAGSDRAVRLTVAAAALRTAVERGEPFATELATVKGLAKDASTVAALEPFAASGVPSNAALAHELSALIQPMLNAVSVVPRDGNILNRLQANAEKLVRIRRVGEVPAGDDPTSTIARIEAKAAQADVAGALAELGKLPPNVRAPAQGWIAKAQLRGKAVEASRQLADGAFAGLNATP